MLQQLNRSISSRIKSFIAVFIGCGALLWNVLACTESPMAFSPDSKTLAFVTMEPYDDSDDMHRIGEHVFRLMSITDQHKLKVIEQTDRFMLTAPCFSPDGKYLCYLKIPLLSKADEQYLDKSFSRKQKIMDQLTQKLPDKEPNSLSVNQSEQCTDIIDLTLPPATMTPKLWKHLICAEPLHAVLVVRDTAAYIERYRVTVEIPVFNGLLGTYLAVRPQYSPDSQWVYLGVSAGIRAINPHTRQMRLFAVPVAMDDDLPGMTIISLSTDGKYIASLLGAGVKDNDLVLALFRTDGQKAIYTRVRNKACLNGLTWAGKNSLAILSEVSGKAGKNMTVLQLDFFHTDGSLFKSLKLKLPCNGDDKSGYMSELAMSADSKYMAISCMNDVYFLSASGKLLHHNYDPNNILVQPVFTPDSKFIAFKRMIKKKENYSPVIGIEYYTPQGKRVRCVDIPCVKINSAKKRESRKNAMDQ